MLVLPAVVAGGESGFETPESPVARPTPLPASIPIQGAPSLISEAYLRTYVRTYVGFWVRGLGSGVWRTEEEEEVLGLGSGVWGTEEEEEEVLGTYVRT